MHARHTLTLAGASLLLGIASTVGVAWALMLHAAHSDGVDYQSSESRSPRQDRQAYITVCHTEHRAVSMYMLITWDMRGWYPMDFPEPGSNRYVVPDCDGQWDDLLSGWASQLREPWAELSARPSSPFPWGGNAPLAIASGWPCRALWCEGTGPGIVGLGPELEEPVFSLEHLTSGGWSIDRATLASLGIKTRQPVALPYRILPAGFSACVATHAAGWFALLFLPSRLLTSFVRRRRLRLGKCPTCAYDLRVTPTTFPCPECGDSK